jgi:NADH-quinone oxidoreductase subunit M
VLSLILFTPLAGAVAILFIDRGRPSVIRWIAAGCAVAAFVLALPLWFRFEPFGSPWQFVERRALIPSIGANYFLGVDGFSALLVLVTTLVGAVAVVSSWSSVTDRTKEHYLLLLVLQTALIGTFVALDFLLFFVFWEATVVSMYFLIGLWGSSRSRRAALKFALYATAGSFAMLLGTLALYFFNHSVTGVYSFDVTEFQRLTIPLATQRGIFLALFLGFAVQSPVFPFHSWLADAIGDAPTAVSIVLAAVGLKLGTYELIRFGLPILPDATRYFVPWVAGLSIVGILYGALLVLAQRDWKRLVAYSSISQIGMTTLAVAALTPAGITGSIVQQISHAIAVSGLLLIAGLAAERHRGVGISSFFVLMILATIGFPGLSGFVGDVLILQGLFVVHRTWAVIGAVGIALGAGGLLWLYQRTMPGAIDNSSSGRLPDLGARDVATLVPLVALTLWIGLYPEPVLRRLQSSAGRVVVRVNPAYGPAIAKAEADCNKPAAPVVVPGAPAGLMVDAPCTDGSTTSPKPMPAGR